MCTQCAHESFMFQGGCYATAKAPGNTMCTNAANGVCSTAADGYFVPPTADRDATKQSVIPCGNDSVVTIANQKQYKGVANCLTCTAPTSGEANTLKAATCTKCADGYFVDAGSGSICSACAANCLTCTSAAETTCQSCTAETHFLGAADGSQGKCIKCDNIDDANWKGVVDCLKCTSSKTSGTPATCTECAGDLYLKTDGSTTSCVAAEQCNNGFFPTTDSSGKKVCVKCSDTDNDGIANCAKCSLKASPTRAGAAVTCTECTSNKLSPLKDACLDICPAGTYNDNSIYKPCHVSCAECNSNANQDSCTACYPGSVLNKGETGNTGTCIPECTGRYAENCADGQCTAVLGGSKYCSKCKSGYAPIDGMCTAVATTSRDASVCTASDGVCTACTGAYTLLSGGCYDTKTLPGSAVCTAVTGNNGQCTTCANGQAYANNNCPACAEGCSACTSGNTQQCTECLARYYLFNSKCVKCSETSSNIQGVPNCVSCTPPTGDSGPVTCYATREFTDPSVNKGDLSTDAIAGISVAAVVVVGGLVGFLCWWFICRGKA